MMDFLIQITNNGVSVKTKKVERFRALDSDEIIERPAGNHRESIGVADYPTPEAYQQALEQLTTPVLGERLANPLAGLAKLTSELDSLRTEKQAVETELAAERTAKQAAEQAKQAAETERAAKQAEVDALNVRLTEAQALADSVLAAKAAGQPISDELEATIRAKRKAP